VRDNIWARGREGQVSITRPEDHTSFTFLRNIVVGRSSPGFVGTPGTRDVRNYRIDSDLNLFWDDAPVAGAVRAANAERPKGADGSVGFDITEALDEEWARLGHDRHSLDADPLLADDFTVAASSPAHALGIRIPDVSGAGPRPIAERGHPLAGPTLGDPFLPTQG